MIREIILGLGFIGFVLFVLIIALLPLICTLVLGTYIASSLGLTGIVWWSFVILFYIIIIGILGMI